MGGGVWTRVSLDAEPRVGGQDVEKDARQVRTLANRTNSDELW